MKEIDLEIIRERDAKGIVVHCMDCRYCLFDELKKHTNSGLICEVFGFEVYDETIANHCLSFEFSAWHNGPSKVENWQQKPCYIPKEQWI